MDTNDATLTERISWDPNHTSTSRQHC